MEPSALNAFTMRRPPIVSSVVERIWPHISWALSDFAFSFFPTDPITHPASGRRMSTKTVSCQLTAIIVAR